MSDANTENPGPHRAGEYRHVVLLLSTLAGVMLLLAERAIRGDWAGFRAFELRAACFAFALALPFTFALLLGSGRQRHALLAGSGVVGLLSVLAALTGLDYAPDLHLRSGPVFGSFCVSMVLAWFVAMPYLQGACEQPLREDYVYLFQRAWDNLLCLLTAHAFLLLCWLIMWLSAGLFNLLGLGFLEYLLGEDWFYFPASGFLLGLGLTLGQTHLGAIRSILRICLSIAHTLLPAVAAITLLFTLAMLLGDLGLLWNTGRASFLLLTLIFLTIALVNGVYADGHSRTTYPRPLRWLLVGGLVVLPGLACLSLYAMGLRIDQYGLTVARLYGLVAIFFALAYSGCYALSALRGLRTGPVWLPGLGSVNRALGLLLVLTLLVSQAPGTNFRNIALKYQLSTIDPQAVEPGNTDWSYLRFELGTPGYEAVQQRLRTATAQNAGPLAAHLQKVLAATTPFAPAAEIFAVEPWLQQGKLEVLPPGTTVPEGLESAIRAVRHEVALLSASKICEDKNQPCLLLGIDLRPGDWREWVLIPPPSLGCDYPVFGRTEGEWQLVGDLQPQGYCIDQDTYAAVREGRWLIAAPEYQDFLSTTGGGDTRWRLRPR